MNNIIKTLNQEKTNKTPIWLMRQAGRYLPEYLEVRSKTNNFLEFCYNPELAAKVTLQPLARFPLSAAIIFSDILVIPHALGNQVTFTPGKGPSLVYDEDSFNEFKPDEFTQFLDPVYQAIKQTKNKLGETALIGFSGAVWTLFAYLLEGQGSKDFIKAKAFALDNKAKTQQIIDILTESIILHLSKQIDNGCDIVKIFDSWAGILPEELIDNLILDPTKKIVSSLRDKYPQIKIICFPKGLNQRYNDFLNEVKPDAIALDYSFSLDLVQDIYEKHKVTIQGNLDPAYLLTDNLNLLESRLDIIKDKFKNIPHIFNLGHGVTPKSKIKNIEFIFSYFA